jgi:TonB family protein
VYPYFAFVKIGIPIGRSIVRDRLSLLAIIGCACAVCAAILPQRADAQGTPPGGRGVDLSRPAGTTCLPPDCYSSLVDEQAKLVAGTAVLTYPDSLRSSGLSGRVTMQFIVDTTGEVRQRSVRFVETPNQLFSMAALRTLAGSRFTAAKLHGKLVSQAMTWTLDLRPSVSGAAAPSQPQPLVQAALAPGTYFEFQVEKHASLLPGSLGPRYPDMLRSSNVQGDVLVEFVVDTMGRADTTTIRVIRSTHDMFTASVRAILPQLQFSPAEVAKRKVKQLVQMPFEFHLTPATKPPAKPPER